MSQGKYRAQCAVHFAGICGLVLLLINLVGLLVPLRSSEIGENYADFSRDHTLSLDDSLNRLHSLSQGRGDNALFLRDATKIFHEGMAHVPRKDIEKNGLDHYRMRVPIWENFVLFFLSYIKPDTYMDYEFCSYRKALERGTGRCGQQSLALVGYLAENNVETGFISLGGHAVATAKSTDGTWHMLDPDYGGAIPFDLQTAEKDPESVVPYYWSQAIVRNNMARIFSPEGNRIKYGGPDARFGRACKIEKASYLLKWLVPASLLLVWFVFLARRGEK